MRADVKALAKRRRQTVNALVEKLLERAVSDDATSDAVPDESVIRDMAILIAVEHCLKLQEAAIPGGLTLSKRLVESAAEAAIERLEIVDTRLKLVLDQ